jgi:hypothetical protein
MFPCTFQGGIVYEAIQVSFISTLYYYPRLMKKLCCINAHETLLVKKASNN